MYTIDEKAVRYVAVKEINSLLCEHCLYFGRRQQDLELERLWCREAENPYFSQNNGRFTGYEALKNIYGSSEQRRKDRYDQLLAQLEPEFVGQPDELRYGTNTISLQTLSTPCIEIAEDMQTAKGLWTVSAQITTVGESGPVGLWAYGKLAADLVRENAQWKIWHLAVYTDFVTPAGEAFAPELGEKLYPAGLGIDEVPTEPAELYQSYSGRRVPRNAPSVPEPYRTYMETFSY